eukprot:TRINITY_DN81189_c0_g1_i1.p1 TRINITY_DN81189_c0_g1~~TRINITY_DN81189_c0_g1_i1.p1  ORF type:complete len:126 (+),score=24.25 TRINITY_DN81189_c0_g1_i1:96-473(+)
MARISMMFFMLLPTVVSAVMLNLGRETSMNDAHLHDQMRAMMSDDDDLDAPGKGQFMDMDAEDAADANDPYMQEAAEGLSRALGPRWNKDYIEKDANRKTSVLMNGISGQENALRGLNNMMRAMR